jgi:acyl-CoA synthetase (NDP forming)
MEKEIMVNDLSALDKIFYPSSIAILGASNREGSFGRLFLEGIIKAGYSPIYPIHPREKELMGLKAYASIKDIPVSIDLVILMVPYSEALKTVLVKKAKKENRPKESWLRLSRVPTPD